ncbi:hypothetical protein K435DRAFT_373753 [Dendrothele bispora CBS 962.96]|uniref:Uncharacterized protein n=1 Tax=Dendrothele bispora (strain CBS 962.96) TaxID=1314807 RepID=A0A4S8LB09_DENBC|nr:hypothetical protein K435DRAFT_373753 [Dendrothele bispora CBS 962.96]
MPSTSPSDPPPSYSTDPPKDHHHRRHRHHHHHHKSSGDVNGNNKDATSGDKKEREREKNHSHPSSSSSHPDPSKKRPMLTQDEILSLARQGMPRSKFGPEFLKTLGKEASLKGLPKFRVVTGLEAAKLYNEAIGNGNR